MRVRASQLATVGVIALTLPLLGAGAAFADSGTDSPTATHDNPSSCLGAERATRNSNGGDRAQGGFGPAQSAYVASLTAPYGTSVLVAGGWVGADCTQ